MNPQQALGQRLAAMTSREEVEEERAFLVACNEEMPSFDTEWCIEVVDMHLWIHYNVRLPLSDLLHNLDKMHRAAGLGY